MIFYLINREFVGSVLYDFVIILMAEDGLNLLLSVFSHTSTVGQVWEYGGAVQNA